jgi:hypothetical protein
MIDEFATCYTEVKATARKEHVCCECHGAIKRGESYFVASGFFSDGPFRKKWCEFCHNLRKQIDATIKDRCEKVAFEELWDAVSEMCSEVEIRNFVHNKNRRGGRLWDSQIRILEKMYS